MKPLLERRHLKLEDNGGVTTLPNSEIFEQLALMVIPPSTSQPPNTQPTPNAEEAVPMPHESPLHSVHSLGHNEGSVSLNELTDLCTSLSKKVGALENELQRDRIVLLEDEEDVEDSSKHGRKILNIYEDLNISLPTELVEDIRSGEKGSSEVSTANIAVTTAEVSTAAENLVYIRRSAEKKKDKGKGIMTEPEPKKKTKKQLEQERLRHGR
ncbi:hypothetical protein Tco_0979862 [Tanacetum coccineum]